MTNHVIIYVDDFYLGPAPYVPPDPPATYTGPACGTVTYADVPLTAPSPNQPRFTIRSHPQVGLNGSQKVVSPANYGRSWSFTCWPTDYGEIAALKGLIWTPAELDICDETWANVYITKFQEREITPDQWEYTIEFTLDNCGV